MTTHDRIHARPPTHHVDRWTEGEVVAVDHDDGGVVVTVRPESGGEPVECRVSDAVYDLFVGRVDDDDRADGDALPGTPVWFRVRGQGRP